MSGADTSPARSGVATRLFPLLLLVAAVPLLAIAAMSYLSGLDLVRQVLGQRTSAVAQLADDHLSARLRQAVRESSIAARGLELRAFLAAVDGADARQIDEARRDLQDFADYFFGAAAGDYLQLVYLDAGGDPVFKRQPSAAGLLPTDPSSAPSLSAADAVGRPAAGRPLRFTRVDSSTGGVTALRIARPVGRRGESRPLGYALLDMPAAGLLPAYGDQEIDLFAAEGGAVLLSTAPEASLWLELVEHAPELPEPVRPGPPRAAAASPRRAETGGDERSTARRLFLRRDGAGHVAAVHQLERPPWTVVAYMNAEPYMARARASGQTTLAMTAAFLLAAGALIFVLTRRVRERTLALERANLALEEANLKVAEANRLKSEFLARMSHDLRTPMNAIIGYTRILLRRAGDVLEPRLLRNLENIQTSADNLLGLINSILDLSRIESGRVELHPEDVDLSRLIEQCATSVAPLVPQGVELRQQLADVPPLHADPERLRRVLMNLLGNAVKFTEAGSITVSLRAADGGVELAVADTGIGIPAEDLPHIFDEFRQVDGVAKAQEGSGLGLAIVRKSVELMGGTIRADSVLGAGTTFTIRLPRSA